jgi:NAD-dependent deacetylase
MTDAVPSDIPLPLVEALRAARHVMVLTGAGISAESGLPTFREKLTGLWERYRPEDLATPDAFRANPALVWQWYADRRAMMANVSPNPAHAALVAIEQRVPQFTLVTQNIDSLHQRAGSRSVIELHGNIARTKCFERNHQVKIIPESHEIPPRCPQCGSHLRPDIVWFGELLPPEALQAAVDAAKSCDLFFSIGTSGVVEPAASLAYRAMDRGATVVQINLDVTNESSRWLYKINGKAGQVLPALVAAAWGG